MKESTLFEAHTSYVLGLPFTRDGRTLVSAGMDNVVKLGSVPDFQENRSQGNAPNGVFAERIGTS